MKGLLEEQTLMSNSVEQTSNANDDSNDNQPSICNTMEEQISDIEDADPAENNDEHLNLHVNQEDRTIDDLSYRKKLLNLLKTISTLKDDGTQHSATPQVKYVRQSQEKEIIAQRRSLHPDCSRKRGWTLKMTSLKFNCNWIKKMKTISTLKDSNNLQPWSCLIVGICIAVLLPYVMWNYYHSTDNHSHDQYLKIYKKEIYNKYPGQDGRMLRAFFKTVESVNNIAIKEDISAVVTMLYYHKETAKCLAEDLANYAAIMINSNKKFIHLNGSSMDEDFSLGCDNFKNKMIENRVLVVYNFQDINDDKVKLFHGIYESSPPYIKDKSFYIALLELGPNQVNVSHLGVKLLARMKELWPSLRADILEPLMARMERDLIIDVKEEKQLTSC